jgi:hypothetical protein
MRMRGEGKRKRKGQIEGFIYVKKETEIVTYR